LKFTGRTISTEVDFVVNEGLKVILIQVCYEIEDSLLRKEG